MGNRQFIAVDRIGGPEVLALKEGPIPDPGRREVVIEHRAAGINFVDIYHRTGAYPLPLPFTPGIEGAGLVHSVGTDVTSIAPGDRALYMAVPPGSYASHRCVPADRVVALPQTIPFDVAAAGFVRSMTADLLLSHVHPVSEQSNVLVHSAAGGLGQLLCRQAKSIGAQVIATVGSKEKAAVARRAGADEVIIGRDADFVSAVRDLTGNGVDLVVDGLGGSVLAQSLLCARPFGTVASIGQAAGRIPPIEPASLPPNARLLRASIISHAADVDNYRASASRALSLLAECTSEIMVGSRYPLARISEAHRMLEQGATSGSMVINFPD